MSPVLHVTAISLLLFAPAISGSLQRHFESPITGSVWRTEGNALACRLVHEIPDYGQAVFTRHAGGALDFHLDLNQRPGRSGNAHIRVVPPPWKHDAAVRDLGTVTFADRSSPFALHDRQARVLLASLEEGMFPNFSYQTAVPVADSVSVSLSAVNFLDAWDRFQQCSAKLLPHDFDALRQSRLLFSPGSLSLDGEARARLDQVASWMKLDRAVAGAVIEGHTDASGRRRENYLLSQRRAVAVRDYLVAQGIAKPRLKVRFFGEERPLPQAAGDGSPRQNRRVDVRLYR